MGLTIKQVSEKYQISADTLRYYEKVGVIPPVTRTPGGTRDYCESDLNWVENAKCMRSAGLSVDFLIEYQRLYSMGNETLKERLDLLLKQQEILLEQKAQLEETLQKLDYKISRYKSAVKTGVLSWD